MRAACGWPPLAGRLSDRLQGVRGQHADHPVGLQPGIDVDTLADLAQLQAGLTHGHPTGLAAAELTAYGVWALVDGATLAELPARLWARANDQPGAGMSA